MKRLDSAVGDAEHLPEGQVVNSATGMPPVPCEPWPDDKYPKWVIVRGSYDPLDTVIKTDYPMHPGDIVNVPRTGEKMRVVRTFPECGQVQVVRGVGSTAPSRIHHLDDLAVLGQGVVLPPRTWVEP